MHFVTPRSSLATAREEVEQVMCGTLDNLFSSTRIKPKDIDIVVENRSLYNPTCSLSSMIVNKYKLRGNTRSFNLDGMRCSAGVIVIDLAKDMLQVHRNTYVVVVMSQPQSSAVMPGCATFWDVGSKGKYIEQYIEI
ncbi:unnamed protein product [Lactuca virosa]|uniref:FAE domain-containing protein n=1 Tax=Lactuca virosa TaxID=75947 RepID=A0AAU9PT19_9ASTR|nr:unnamed protein product [Lactuca virosa]